MKLKRRALLVEPPATAAPDIAFILIVFFLVCASVQPNSGRSQILPRSEAEPDKANQSKNLEVSLGPSAIVVNGENVPLDRVTPKLLSLLAGKNREEDRVVIVKSASDTPYDRWIDVTGRIENAGGIITLQLELEQTVTTD
jgi:biopolymer transport protein ExbD